MKRLRRAAVAVAILLTLSLLGVPARAAESPRDLVQETVTQVLEILKNQSLDAAAKRRAIEKVAEGCFEFETLSRLTLARNWSRLTPEEQQRFVQEFRQHLSVTYGKNLDNYHNERVAVLGDREETRGDWSVKSKIVRGGGSDDIEVDYRLRKVGDEWKIIDVTIEGVSLVANFRAQFQEILANSNPDHLLTLLAQKNAAGESILPPEKSHGGGAATSTAQP